MRPRPSTLANGFAWFALLGLAALAVVIVLRLGPVGLILLGLMTLFVCSQFSLDDAVPTWSTEVFKARMASHRSPEQQAAQASERLASLSPLRFYRWCGVLLTASGIAGFAWQQWQ